MAYVRAKKTDGREYYQLVESRRVEGQPRQRVLVHLGKHPTVDEALREWPKEIRFLRGRAAKEREAGKIWPNNSRIRREILKRVQNTEKRADDLEASLTKLRELRKRRIA